MSPRPFSLTTHQLSITANALNYAFMLATTHWSVYMFTTNKASVQIHARLYTNARPALLA